MRKLRFALFGNVFQAKKSSSVQKLLCLLEERQADLQVDATFYRFLTEDLQIAVPASARVITDDDFEADFLISMGGDGSFLEAARRVGDKGIPILGVNMGRLGFLADVLPEDIEEVVTQIYDGQYSIDERCVLQLDYDRGTQYRQCIEYNEPDIDPGDIGQEYKK